MTIYLPPSVLGAIGAAIGALIIAVLWLMVKFVRHLAGFADAMERSTQVNAALNDELLSVIKERQQDRAIWQEENSTLQASFTAHKQACEEVNAQMSTELQKLRIDLVAAQSTIKTLQGETERLRTQLDDAKSEIARLNESSKQKDERIEQLRQRVSDLETKLARSEAARLAAERERDQLAERIAALKHPAPITGAMSEPGERKPPEETEDKMSEENTNDGH